MRIVEKKLSATCEWCNDAGVVCDIITYGEGEATLICERCMGVIKKFSETFSINLQEL